MGKVANNHTMKQEDISELLVEKARQAQTVVRLKGGDVYVFGRGGEEGEVLHQAGIEFEVVPGISSSIGGIAYAGIPITHRGIARSFHVITGHHKDGVANIPYDLYAKLSGTLVFLMGMGNLDNICNGLMDNGMDKSMPVAIVEKASSVNQRTTVGNLSNIAKIAKEVGAKAPGLIVVGKVVEKRESLSFFETKPLFGKKVIVTRARVQESALVESIKDLGGEAITMPVIKINPIIDSGLDVEINEIERYSYLILTSYNSVKIFFESLSKMGLDSRKLAGLKIVAVGNKTDEALKAHGISADIVPEKFVSESIYETLKDKLTKDDRVLLPISDNARDFLSDKLGEICDVKRVGIYKTIKANLDYSNEIQMIEDGQIDYLTFTSSSTVENFVDVIGKENLGLLDGIKIISIGPITSKKIIEFGLKIYAEAKEHNIDGIIKELVL